MLWLGNWQLDKWERRNAQLAAYAARDGQTTKAVTDLRDGNLTQFDKVALELSFDAKRQILIDSIVKDGKNGFYVISLAFTGDNQPLLVNRGWIAQTPTREPLGDLELPDVPVSVTGRVGGMPVGGLRLGDIDTNVSAWPAVMHYPTLEEAGRMLSVELADWVLLAESGPGQTMRREWTPAGLPPERHLGYAVQWFALTAALTLLLLITYVRSRRQERSAHDK